MNPNKYYIWQADLLRAVAVIAVFLNHWDGHVNGNFLPKGYLGVDVFFVISGFVIAYSLSRSTHSSISQLVPDFLCRRLHRLLPALLFYVIPVSLLTTIARPYPDAYLFTGISSLLGLSNIYLSSISSNYFSDSSSLNPFLHTWSLGIEEQFYVILLLLFSLKFVRFGPRSSAILNTPLSLLLFVGSIFILHNCIYR